MGHLGSLVVASEKVCSDSLYWNECRSATPFSMVGCTSAVQLVGKFTFPSWSGGAADKVSASRTAGGMARTNENGPRAKAIRLGRRMIHPPCCLRGFYLRRLVFVGL